MKLIITPIHRLYIHINTKAYNNSVFLPELNQTYRFLISRKINTFSIYTMSPRFSYNKEYVI